MKKKLNKDVRLTIIGENTEGTTLLWTASEYPIMHIVRNSMDHGIEPTVEERIAAGKDPQAEIVLSAAHTGSEVIISVAMTAAEWIRMQFLQKQNATGF